MTWPDARPRTGDVVRWVGVAEDGVRLSVEADADLGAELLARWPPTGLVQGDARGPADRCMRVASGGPGRVRQVDVTVDGDEVAGGWCRVESDLALFAAEHLVGRVAVHAGLVVWGGAAILLPGSSHAGKSTLCLALNDLGAEVRSDEYALVDPELGLVAGWRRPMRRRRRDGAGVDRIGLSASTNAAVPVGLVAGLRYDPLAEVAARRWSDVGQRRGAELVLANAVGARAAPEAAFSAALAVARDARAVEGVRGDARAAAQRLLVALEEGVG